MFLQYIAVVDDKISAGQTGIPVITANAVLENALNIVYFAAGAVAVIAIIIAGYTFTTAVYDPAKITQAKNTLIYATTGLVIVLIAFVATQFIIGGFR
jgi:hypothetical protein